MTTSIVNLIGKDFGGYWDVGTLGDLGQSLKDVQGKAYGGHVKLFDALITPFTMTWFGVTNQPNSYNMFMLNMYWDGVDYQPRDNSLGFFVSGTNGLGWAYWIDLDQFGININDGQYHHIMLNWDGLTGGKPDNVYIYIDGVGYNAKIYGTDFSDTPALTGTVSNFTNPIYVGCDAKTNSWTPIDMSTLNIADLVFYDRALDPLEIASMHRGKGRYMPNRGLLSRHTFMFDGKNKGYNGYTAVPQNNGGGSSNPTILTDKAPMIAGRRKVM